MRRLFFLAAVGLLGGLLLALPDYALPLPLKTNEAAAELVRLTSPSGAGEGPLALLFQLLPFVVMAAALGDAFMRDAPQYAVYVFPRAGSRVRWLARKTAALFGESALVWSLMGVSALALFAGSNHTGWAPGYGADFLRYWLTTALLGGFLCALLVNVLSLWLEKWLAVLAGLTVYGVQQLAVQLLYRLPRPPRALALLPCQYVRFSVWSVDSHLPHVSPPAVLLAEGLCVAALAALGLLAARKRLGRLGEG